MMQSHSNMEPLISFGDEHQMESFRGIPVSMTSDQQENGNTLPSNQNLRPLVFEPSHSRPSANQDIFALGSDLRRSPSSSRSSLPPPHSSFSLSSERNSPQYIHYFPAESKTARDYLSQWNGTVDHRSTPTLDKSFGDVSGGQTEPQSVELGRLVDVDSPASSLKNEDTETPEAEETTQDSLDESLDQRSSKGVSPQDLPMLSKDAPDRKMPGLKATTWDNHQSNGPVNGRRSRRNGRANSQRSYSTRSADDSCKSSNFQPENLLALPFAEETVVTTKYEPHNKSYALVVSGVEGPLSLARPKPQNSAFEGPRYSSIGVQASIGNGNASFLDNRANQADLLGGLQTVSQASKPKKTPSPSMNAPRENPPGICIRGFARNVTSRALLSIIRVPHGRVRTFIPNSGAQEARVYFFELAGHELFLERARSGRLASPWPHPFTLDVNTNDILTPAAEEDDLGATRVLLIQNLETPPRSAEGFLGQLTAASNGRQYEIEKAHFGRFRSQPDRSIITIHFLSIRTCGHVKRLIQETAWIAAKYTGALISYGHDECNTSPQNETSEYRLVPPLAPPTAAPIFPHGAVTVYNAKNGNANNRPLLDLDSFNSMGDSHGNGSLLQVHPRSAGPAGLVIIGLPKDISYSRLLSNLRGGRLLQCEVVRENTNVVLTAPVNGIVLYRAKAEAERAFAALSSPESLWVPGSSPTGGRWYQVRRTSLQENSRVNISQIPAEASRCFSVLFDDFPINSSPRAGTVWNFLSLESDFWSELEKVVFLSNGVQKKVQFQLVSVLSAMMLKQEFSKLNLFGTRPVVEWENDPCDQ